MNEYQPPICDYEDSDYQHAFWGTGERDYEDLVEEKALFKLLPESGARLLEVGAGAGRNTPRYSGFNQIVLLDYSRTQLEKAQRALGRSERYIYVVGDVYRLPFHSGVFDASTMIRTIHHLVDPLRALEEIRATLVPGSAFILEYANKQNMKAILRWLFRRQAWNPFSPEPIEFAELNFNFHPAAVERWLVQCGFHVDDRITVSHFRIGLLKRTVPLKWLVTLDDLAQGTGNACQLTPSVFLRAKVEGSRGEIGTGSIWRCPACQSAQMEERTHAVACESCGRAWGKQDGIYDFKTPLSA